MIEIDGSSHSGSGTIVRFGVAFAALLGRPVVIHNARAARKKPGLRPQHLTSVQACAALCGARTEGVAVDSREFAFWPGTEIRGGSFEWDIGTAGSATMLALGTLPLAAFAGGRVTARITGGLFQDFAPSPYHMMHVLLPVLSSMKLEARLTVVRPGYVPAGGGILDLEVTPVGGRLQPIELMEQGTVDEVRGEAISSHLEDRHVSHRMAKVCGRILRKAGLGHRIEARYENEAARPGAGLAIWAESSTGCRLGADRAGALKRSSENIGRSVARDFLQDWESGATVDRHLADQLVLFAALAEGVSRFRVPRITDHLETNLWLASLFGADTGLQGDEVTVRGIGVSATP
jgi:RNA 3'-terminal phosphate cyclase (ATP)